MKVLQLCLKPPYPPVDGGTMAMNSVTQGLLAAGCEVKVLSVCSDKHPVKEQQMGERYTEQTRFEAVHLDLRVKPLAAAAALLCGESYHVKRFESEAFAARLREILQAETYDVVHMESIFLTPYVPVIRRYSQAKIVLRAHNVEHQIWRKVAQCTRNPFKRWYLKQLSLTLGAYEREHANGFDGVVCISPNDAEFFKQAGCRKKITTIPFGIDVPELVENVSAEPNTLFHIGSMDWMPNQEGIRWFLDKVWPIVHQQVPQARLYLAGRKMPADLMEAQIEGVTVVGEVPDSMYFISSKQINVVPLLSGSGIRVKIIEAMSVGKTVISTTVGAAGINYTDGKDLLIADTPEAFAQQIARCLNDEEFCQQVGRNAFDLIAHEYDNRRLTQRLTDFYTTLLGKK